MDGEILNDVIMVAEETPTEFPTIPLMLEFREPEIVNPTAISNEINVEIEPQQEPVAELAVPEISTAATTVTAIRLVSGADDNLTTTAADVEDENIDRQTRRTLSRGRRTRSRRSRSRSRRSRSRRSHSRRNRSRRGRRSRSRNDDSDFSVQIADDEVSTQLVAGTSHDAQKTTRGNRRARKVTGGRGGEKATLDSRVSEKATRGTCGGRKSVRGSRRGRKIAKGTPARTMWSERLRPLGTHRNKKSKAK